MSHPYIIWTLRRTGGTTLTAFVNDLSEHPTIQHEPFNEERAYGYVSRAWRADGDADVLRLTLRDTLAHRPVIKHCFELVAPEVNQGLLDISIELGYRHILLDRRAEVERILSLELAKLTGVWGKAGSAQVYDEIVAGTRHLDPINIAQAVHHLRFCQQRREQLRHMLAVAGQDAVEIYFEDVYTDFDQGRRTVRRLLDHIQLNPETVPNYQQRLRDALQKKGQNSARVIDLVPNIAETRDALQAEFDLWHAPQPDPTG